MMFYLQVQENHQFIIKMKYIAYYGSLYECPYGFRLKSCPVYPMNYESFTDKYNWFDCLPLVEKESVAEHHQQCAGSRAREKHIVI